MPTSANPFGDFLNLPSRQTVPPSTPYMPPADRATYGSLGKPGDGSSLPYTAKDDGGGPDWGGIAGVAAPLVASLFGDNPYKGKRDTSDDAVQTMAKMLAAQGSALSSQGQDALAPVLKYLMAVTGADPGALNTAIQPEKARVLDQYDTARKALQFAPRGGGQASATLQAGTRAASDISTLTAEARRSGVANLGTLGKGLLDAGIGETNAAARTYGDAAALYGRASDSQGSAMAGIGKAIGTALPFILAAL